MSIEQRPISMSGSVIHAGRQDSNYVLTRLRDGRQVYWTGEMTSAGPRISTSYQNAHTFPDAKAAYSAGGHHKWLDYFHVAPLYPAAANDGFVPGWWHEAT